MIEQSLIEAILEAQVRARAAKAAYDSGLVFTKAGENARIEDAIEQCILAQDMIDEILASVPPASNPDDPIEVGARAYQREFIAKQVERAARSARERKLYFASLKTDQQRELEKRKCADGIEGTLHWFRYYAWGYDPRAEYLPIQPLVPFGCFDDDESDFQARYIKWLEVTTFQERRSGSVEKARDMGATVIWLCWGAKQWIFRRMFSALLSSATEDLVDSKEDQDTLFQKVRFILKHLPYWMLPKGFDLDKDMPYMRLHNPENGATITGQAPTANVGRQRRRTCVLKDESAAWPYGGFQQADALSATSKSKFDVSSVQGRFNYFAVNIHSGRANVFIMDWREHPWKDLRWYNALGPGHLSDPMTAATIAQEVDRDYEASQPGKVFKDWEETRTCIGWNELIKFYEQFDLAKHFYHVDGTLKVPTECEWGRFQDRGETEGHPRMTLYCFRPPKHWPLSDSVFWFIEHMAPTGSAIGEFLPELIRLQEKWKIHDRKPKLSLNSHEAKEERRVYLQDYGWLWHQWQTDYNVGIPKTKEWIRAIEPHKPNPIRPALMGRARMYLVCANKEAELFFNEKDQKHFVSPALTSEGFARLRAEMPVYHYPPEEAGKPLAQQRPERIFDDSIACFEAGTQIQTSKGSVSIETIKSGDVVATRFGWQRVIEGWQSSLDALISEVRFSGGRILRGTENHPVWVKGAGWKPLGDLQLGDELTQCPKWCFSKVSNSIDTRTQRSLPTATILSRTSTIQSEALRLYMLKFGKTIMGQFRRVITFTIRQGLRTRFATWNAFPVAAIWNVTAKSYQKKKKRDGWLRRKNYSTKLADTANSPFSAKTLNGYIAMISVSPGFAAERFWKRSREIVSDVGRGSIVISNLPSAFAASYVGSDFAMAQRLPMKRTPLFARDVSETSKPRVLLDSAPVVVESEPRIVYRAPVYNLTVESHPEYFANGVLVHNCIRGCAAEWGPRPREKSKEDRLRDMLDPSIRIENLKDATQEQRDRAILSSQIWMAELEAEDRKPSIGPLKVVRTVPRRK